jgi:hypothetical protein
MRSKHVVLQTIALLLFILPVQAGVTRIEIISRADLLNGKEFGLAGAYENRRQSPLRRRPEQSA